MQPIDVDQGQDLPNRLPDACGGARDWRSLTVVNSRAVAVAIPPPNSCCPVAVAGCAGRMMSTDELRRLMRRSGPSDGVLKPTSAPVASRNTSHRDRTHAHAWGRCQMPGLHQVAKNIQDGGPEASSRRSTRHASMYALRRTLVSIADSASRGGPASSSPGVTGGRAQEERSSGELTKTDTCDPVSGSSSPAMLAGRMGSK